MKHGVVRPIQVLRTSKTLKAIMEIFKSSGKEEDTEQSCRMDVGRMYKIAKLLGMVSLPNYIFLFDLLS